MHLLNGFLASFLVIILASCVMTEVPKQAKPVLSKEQEVVKRAQERWDALFTGNLGGAYEYISPAGRLGMPVTEYVKRVNPQYWRKIKVREAKCEPELCDVFVDLDYEVAGLPLSQVITEKWILDSGKWWFVYRG